MPAELWPQISRRMKKTKERGSRGQKNRREGGYFDFLRSYEGKRKVYNPDTGNVVQVSTLSKSDKERTRTVLKREYKKYREKWQERDREDKEEEMVKEEGQKPLKLRKKHKTPPKQKPRRRPRRPKRPEWRKTPGQHNKSANKDTALLSTLKDMEEGHSRRVVFHHAGARYRLVYGNVDNVDYFVHVTLLEGKPDPTYLIGKLIGPPSKLVRYLWRMPKVVETMAYTANRIVKPMDDKATPLRERLSRFARENPIMRKAVSMILKDAGPRRLDSLQNLFLRIVNGRIKEGAEKATGFDTVTDVELDASAHLSEAAKMLEALSNLVLSNSSNSRVIRAGLVSAMSKIAQAALLTGKLVFLRQREKEQRDFLTSVGPSRRRR